MKDFSRRILLFTTAYKPFIGGSEVAAEEIVKRLPDVFFDIVTPKFRRSLPRLESGGNFCIHRIGWGWAMDKLFFPLSGFLFARKLAKENRYDFFHVFQASQAGGAAWLLKIFNKQVPMILTLQEGQNLDGQNWFIKFCRGLIIRKANKITAISEYLKKFVHKVKKGATVAVLPNGVDIDNFSREFSYGELSMLRDRLRVKPGEKTIVSVSRLVPKNGLGDLIRAVAALNRESKEPVFRCLLVGEGGQKSELSELSETAGVKDKIIFAGQIDRIELPKYLKIADVFVRPSLSEGLGSAFLEAMAASVPVIGTPVGGIPDFLKDGETGLFCRVGDPEDIAQKVRQLVSDEPLRKKLAGNGLGLVKEKYDWKIIAAQYAELYN